MAISKKKIGKGSISRKKSKGSSKRSRKGSRKNRKDSSKRSRKVSKISRKKIKNKGGVRKELIYMKTLVEVKTEVEKYSKGEDNSFYMTGENLATTLFITNEKSTTEFKYGFLLLIKDIFTQFDTKMTLLQILNSIDMWNGNIRYILNLNKPITVNFLYKLDQLLSISNFEDLNLKIDNKHFKPYKSEYMKKYNSLYKQIETLWTVEFDIPKRKEFLITQYADKIGLGKYLNLGSDKKIIKLYEDKLINIALVICIYKNDHENIKKILQFILEQFKGHHNINRLKTDIFGNDKTYVENFEKLPQLLRNFLCKGYSVGFKTIDQLIECIYDEDTKNLLKRYEYILLIICEYNNNINTHPKKTIQLLSNISTDNNLYVELYKDENQTGLKLITIVLIICIYKNDHENIKKILQFILEQFKGHHNINRLKTDIFGNDKTYVENFEKLPYFLKNFLREGYSHKFKTIKEL